MANFEIKNTKLSVVYDTDNLVKGVKQQGVGEWGTQFCLLHRLGLFFRV